MGHKIVHQITILAPGADAWDLGQVLFYYKVFINAQIQFCSNKFGELWPMYTSKLIPYDMVSAKCWAIT